MYKRKNHSKYCLKAHIIFVTKYRKKVVNKGIRKSIKYIFAYIESKSHFFIEQMETDNDHIHLLIDYEPKISILQIVRKLKQESTIYLWNQHNDFLLQHYWKKRIFWSSGYFATSIGVGASYEAIQKYIKN